MEIDPMENELDYPARDKKEQMINVSFEKIKSIRANEENKQVTPPLCPLCGKEINFDNIGAYCSCGYKERL